MTKTKDLKFYNPDLLSSGKIGGNCFACASSIAPVTAYSVLGSNNGSTWELERHRDISIDVWNRHTQFIFKAYLKGKLVKRIRIKVKRSKGKSINIKFKPALICDKTLIKPIKTRKSKLAKCYKIVNARHTIT